MRAFIAEKLRFIDRTTFEYVIVGFEPPRLVRFSEPPATGEDGFFQFVLAPVSGGTQLTFTQHGTPGFVAEGWPPAGLLVGWHGALDDLGAWLEGRASPAPDEALRTSYAAQALATRPPPTRELDA